MAEVYDVLHYSGVSDFSQYKDANDSGTIGEVGKIENQDVLHGVKDVFSPNRATRIDWIEYVLKIWQPMESIYVLLC